MKAEKLAGLEPASVFAYFEELSAIPRGSGNTEAVSDYLVAFANAHNLAYIQDAYNNVILFHPGTPGYTGHTPVILQGHMDMVCEKDPDVAIDMAREGLDITHDGAYVFARGTTLGGDDGIAVAYALALLADDAIPHPPLEVVITVDEEIGLLGANAIEVNMLKGRTMINVDSEEEGVFTVSCAGGATATLTLPVRRRTVCGPCVRLRVEGLRGGHSGMEIGTGRANANKVMGELLSRIQAEMPLCLTSLAGGAKDNAIPRACQATAVVLGAHPERINAIAEALQAQVREQYDEPEAVICGDDVDALGGNALTSEDTAKAIGLLQGVPNGVQAMSADIPGLVQTSLNLGILALEDDLRLTFSVRSSSKAEKQALLEKLRETVAFYGGDYACAGEYPAWEYRADSPLREIMVATFTRMFGREPQVIAIHAGLECGLLSEKLPGLDCISIGPNMKDIHTSREKLDIASTARTWRFLLEVLRQL